MGLHASVCPLRRWSHVGAVWHARKLSTDVRQRASAPRWDTVNSTSTAMADDRTKANGPDRNRIDVNEEYELRDWSKKFGVSPEQIKEAVRAVGDRADDVEMHLKGSRASSNASSEAGM